MERFDKFTDRARGVLTYAQDEARRFDHNYIGTEHLLLGLVRQKDGMAARVLADMSVDLAKVRTAVEFIIGRGAQPVVGEVGLTPRAKRVIELAIAEARTLRHHYIGTEHLLLGIIREGEGIAAGVLESLGVDLDKTRQAVIATLKAVGAVDAAVVVDVSRGPARRYVRYEDWSVDARAALVDAQAIAVERHHAMIDTEHLLFGCVAAPQGPAVATLALAGAGRDALQSALVSDLAERAPDVAVEGAALTLEAREALALAEGEASRTDAPAVSVGHLLVAFALMPTTGAGRALAALGITTARLREVLSVSDDDEPEADPDQT